MTGHKLYVGDVLILFYVSQANSMSEAKRPIKQSASGEE
jgi:hypothetical protein